MFSAIPDTASAMATAAANHSTIAQPHTSSSSSYSDPPDVSAEVTSASTTTPPKNPSNLMTRAVVANDTDVSNGFVKDGKTLPYVFEANDAGVRKRSSKILPICAICNRKFVCVTTMKRHLVTHTGQKPFSCRECGKQYTQKGNLRVHERTHRNDRPFECNICRQKFFRKEPMQKHQWRQHGIVHSKLPESLPPSQSIEAAPAHVISSSVISACNPPPQIAAVAVAVSSSAAPPAVFSSLTEEESNDVELVFGDDIPDQVYTVVTEQVETSLPAKNDDVAPEDFSSTRRPSADAPAPPRAHSQESRSLLPRFQFSKMSEKYEPVPALRYETATVSEQQPPKAHSNSYTSHLLSHDQRSSEERHLDNAEVVNLSRMMRDRGERETDGALPYQKPKMKLAAAYQREMLEWNREQEREEEGGARDLGGGVSLPLPHLDQLALLEQSAAGLAGDVECTCKSCGQVLPVHADPHNMTECSHCHVKYNSPASSGLHVPLQCAGCLNVFPHKPALKAHQTGGSGEDSRPFRCCVCGYHFRQKAHLQKHQWRIHRKQDQPLDVAGGSEEDANLKVTIQDIINSVVEPSLSSRPEASAKHLLSPRQQTGAEASPAKSAKSCRDATPAPTAPSGAAAALDLSPGKAGSPPQRTKTGRLHNIVHNIVNIENGPPDADHDMIIDGSPDAALSALSDSGDVAVEPPSDAAEAAASGGVSPVSKKVKADPSGTSSHVHLPSISGLIHKPANANHSLFGSQRLPSEVVSKHARQRVTSADAASCQPSRTV